MLCYLACTSSTSLLWVFWVSNHSTHCFVGVCWQGLKTNIAAKNIAVILCCYPDSIYPPRQLTQCLNNFFLPFFKSGQLLVSSVYSILFNLIFDDVSLHLFFNRHLWWLKNWITQLPSCPWLQVFWNDGTFQIISENQSMCFTYC